jgi:hypothetical protein
MKSQSKILFGALLLAAAGCEGGYVAAGGDTGVYYGGDPWIENDVIVTGGDRPWYHDYPGAYVHPEYRGEDRGDRGDHRRR